MQLERTNIEINDLVRTIYCLPKESKQLHQDFLMTYAKAFMDSDTISEVFLRLYTHTYWDYLNIDILDHISTEFSLPSQTQLEDYKRQQQQFMEQTTVEEFYEAEGGRQHIYPPPGFVKLISQHKWKPPTYLDKVDKFRKRFACKYDLCDTVAILISVGYGSVVITIMIPESMIMMINSTGIEFFKEHAIVHLQLNATCVYNQASEY